MSAELGLSSRQRLVLHALVRIWEREQIVPTLAELKEATGINSLRGVTLQLEALEKKGYIKRYPGSARAITVLRKAEPSELKRERRDREETQQLRRFISYVKKIEGVSLKVKAREVSPGDHTKKNYDALLIGPADTRWAVELTELHESDTYRRDNVVWSEVIAELHLHLRRWQKVKGAFYVALPISFEVSKAGVPRFAEELARKITDAIAAMGTAPEVKVDGIRISRLAGIRGDDCIIAGMGGGWIDSKGTMRDRLQKALEEKREQLSAKNVYQRVLVVTNYYMHGTQGAAIDGLSQIDLTKYPEVDKIYIEFKRGEFTRVYDRAVGEHLRSGAIPSKEPERTLAFDFLLRLMRANSEEAWPVLEGLLQGVEPSRAFPSTEMREALADLAQQYAKTGVRKGVEGAQLVIGEGERLSETYAARAIRIIERLIDDPDPPISGDSRHEKVKAGEDPKIITSVRGRLCWAIQQLALDGQTIGRAFELLMELLGYSSRDPIQEKNLYIIQQAVVPLIEISKRKRLLSDKEQARLAKVVWYFVEKYAGYRPIGEYLVNLLLCYRDLSPDQAEKALISLSGVDGAAPLFLYFGYYREKHHPEKYSGASIRALLAERIRSGGDGFRAELAWQLAEISTSAPAEIELLWEMVDLLASTPYYHSTHLHLSRVAENLVTLNPEKSASIYERLLNAVATGGSLADRSQRALPDRLSPILTVLLHKGEVARALSLLELLVHAIEVSPTVAPYRLDRVFLSCNSSIAERDIETRKALEKLWQRVRTALPGLGQSWDIRGE